MFITLLDVLLFLTLAYKELIGMAFRSTIPYLINMIFTKTFCRGTGVTVF